MSKWMTIAGEARQATTIGAGLVFLVIGSLLIWPMPVANALSFAFFSIVEIAPLVGTGILIAAWAVASDADVRIAHAFEGRMAISVIIASAIGAVTPVCGVTVLPLMAGMLATGVPLAPVMAFWLASPITDPAMLATTAATLGYGFALGKTMAALGLGLWGGAVTIGLSGRSWITEPLRDNAVVTTIRATRCGEAGPFEPFIWRNSGRRHRFARQAAATSRLILVCLFPAFAAEYVLNAVLTPEALISFLGKDAWWAIPFAVFIGAPAYLDGYAALPLTRGLVDHGMSQGAAMAFLVSGGVVSVWGALAILPVLRVRPFMLYLALALSGSMLAGYLFEWAI
ncbi:MAG: permease [Rhodospirillales bacterium]|nr:permease [Rhodospirillales bacterium]